MKQTLSIKVYLFFLIINLLSVNAEEFIVKEKSISFELKTRGTTKALLSAPLITPGRYLPLFSIVPDGSFVEKGQAVASFDSANAEFEYQNLLFEKEVVEQQLKFELSTIENNALNKEDLLATHKGQLNFQKARLKRFQEMPLEEEVKKAEGQFRIAELEYNSAFKDFERDKERYKKEFISKGELEKSEQNFKEKKAGLEYAAAFLEYQKLPVTKGELRKIELEVENAGLNVQEVEDELSKIKFLKDFEIKTAKQKKEIIDQKIAAQKNDLENTVVRAPIAGFVKHNDSGIKLGPGAKFWSEFRFAEIPDFTSIVFETQFPEDSRKYFNLNDPVVISVHGRSGEVFEGFISYISSVPTDIGEKGVRTYGSTAKITGIKIYQVQVKPKKFETWMKPGMNADLNIMSAKKFTLPAVPVKFLQIKEGKNYLAKNGIYELVNGFVNQGWFMIESENYLGQKVSLDGEFKNNQEKSQTISASGNFIATGEVVPYESTQVIVGDVYREAKITWLKDEETTVKVGDLLIQMNSDDIDKQISRYETDKVTWRNKVNSSEKAADLKKSENEFKILRTKNLVESKKVEWEKTLNEVEQEVVLRAKLSFLKAQIDHEAAVSKTLRLKAQRAEFTSKLELERAERDERRKKLLLELAEINYKEVKNGATEVERSKAELEYVVKKVEYENLVLARDWQVEQKESEVRKDQLKLNLTEIQLQDTHKMKENLVIKSPAEGIIRYEKVWDNGVIDQIKLGTGLREGMVAMTIPNLSSLFIQVDLPEKYFLQVKVGQEVEVRIPSASDKNFKGKVEHVKFLFTPLARRDSQLGIYSSQEPLGQTVFTVKIALERNKFKIKPGVIAEVYFPFKEL